MTSLLSLSLPFSQTSGIMMISNYGGFKRMLGFCKTRVPKVVADRVEALKDDKNGLKEYGIEFAKETSIALLENNIDVLHYYTLNLEGPVKSVLDALGRSNEVVVAKEVAKEVVDEA